MSENLGEWIKAEFGSQQALAEELGIQQSRISKWLKGREPIPETYQKAIRKLKFNGPWPREEVQRGQKGTYGVGSANIMERPNFSQGLPKEAREAIQKAVQMVEDFISVVPAEKRLEDSVKKGLFVMLVADLLVAGRQEEIPDMMKDVIQAFSLPAPPPKP